MRVIDPHAHMTSRTTDDYRDARRSGVECVVEPSFWSGSDKLYPESFFDYFEHIIDFETERAERVAGMDHYVTVAINPKEADDREMAAAVIDRLPEYFDRDRVVGVGEIGFNLQTDAEEWAFREQLRLAEAHELPVIIHLPHTDKPAGAARTVEILEEEGATQERIIIDHNEPGTMETTAATDCWLGFTLYPGKISIDDVMPLLEEYGTDRTILNSSADWDDSDPLAVPKARDAMLDAGWDREVVRKLVFENPIEFFSQSDSFTYRP
jgi:hypothetical protein